VWVYYS